MLLGEAALALHDHMLLMPGEISDAMAVSGLQDQVERVRITPHALSFEEMSKLWMAFQTQYRVSLAYEVAVVLIDSTRQRQLAPPVRTANVVVATLSSPTVVAVNPQIATPGTTVTVSGSNLGDPATRVVVGGRSLVPATLAAGQLTVALPPDLPAGASTLKVVQERALGIPPIRHPGTGFESNTIAIVVAPQITTPTPISVARGATLTLAVTPPIGLAQRAGILIGDQLLTPPPHAAGDPATSNALSCLVPAGFVPGPGTYLLRVQIDGAASPLVTDTNRLSPTFNQFIGPLVTVT